MRGCDQVLDSYQFSFVGGVAVVGVAALGSLQKTMPPGRPGHDVVQGASVKRIMLQRHHHLSVHHPVMTGSIPVGGRIVR